MNIEELRTGSNQNINVQSDSLVNPNLAKTISVEERDRLRKARLENAPEDADINADAKKVGEDIGGGRRKFVPETLGIYDAKREEEPDDVEKILDKFDNEYLPRKIAEMEQFNAALDMTGELTEEEVLQMQGKEYITKAIEDPRRINALKTHELTEEETREKYEREQEILRKKDEEEKMHEEKVKQFRERTSTVDNSKIDYNPDHYNNLPGMEDEPVVGVVEELQNPTMYEEEYEIGDNEDMEVMEEEKIEVPEDVNVSQEDETAEVKPKVAIDEYMVETAPVKSEEKELTNPRINLEENKEEDVDEDENDFVLPKSEIIEDKTEDAFDDEEESSDEETVMEDGRETDEQITERFKKSIREKIKPVTKAFDISTYSVATKAIPFSNATQQSTNHYRSAKWALMSTGRPITMRSFKSTELDEMSNNNRTDSRYMIVKKQYSMIFNHILDPKPKTVEEWAKMNSFLDLDHIWFAIYRSCYEGANYIPRDCVDTRVCRNVFLTEDTPIMDMVKFKDKDAKKKFFNILNKDSNITSLMYTSEITPVSDNYAISFREPSIYNIVFESALLESDFIERHQDLVSVLAYIDKIYRIDHVHHTLVPIDCPVFHDNVTKTYKARIKVFSKVLDTLTSDQYRYILAIIDSINKRGDEVSYVYPEVSCPKCQKIVPEAQQNPQNMVFLRHQLVTLAL